MPPPELPEDMTSAFEIETLLDALNDRCYSARRRAYRRCIDEGGSESECRAKGRAAHHACELMIGLAERRLQAAARQETLEKWLGEAESSAKLWKKIFADPKHAMTLSKHIAQGLSEAGIQLDKDETFACLITVAKKPAYVSAVVPSAPGPDEDHSRLVQILEPDLMEAVLEAVEADKAPG